MISQSSPAPYSLSNRNISQITPEFVGAVLVISFLNFISFNALASLKSNLLLSCHSMITKQLKKENSNSNLRKLLEKIQATLPGNTANGNFKSHSNLVEKAAFSDETVWSLEDIKKLGCILNFLATDVFNDTQAEYALRKALPFLSSEECFNLIENELKKKDEEKLKKTKNSLSNVLILYKTNQLTRSQALFIIFVEYQIDYQIAEKFLEGKLQKKDFEACFTQPNLAY